MRRIALLSTVLIFFFGSAHAFDACEVEKTVEAFFRSLSPACKQAMDISFENILYVAETGEDYSDMRPSIKPSDIQVKVKVKFCQINDRYFLWVRKNNSQYNVLTYTSFSQPE